MLTLNLVGDGDTILSCLRLDPKMCLFVSADCSSSLTLANLASSAAISRVRSRNKTSSPPPSTTSTLACR